MLTTTTTTAVWILEAVFCSLYPKANTEIQSACPCQVQIELWMLSSWLCYHIKLLDSQLPSKALTYYTTNVFMLEDRI